ncbi:MAG: choice-of-anchor D domain-containing protein [Planctomycetes bacterium]|nr:choice-of-anchor D domain-containing protein [Planctomycetota bacterium]
MRYSLLVILIAFAATAHAQDYGDAPASYGTITGGSTSGGCQLGQTRTKDTVNPVTPAWTGDTDDGIVGTPLWNPWSSFNQLTVHVQGWGMLYMFVDADDSGTFEQSEMYSYAKYTAVIGPIDLTITGIELKNPGGYNLNGANKVAVRIIIANMIGAMPPYTPSGSPYIGEVEDWLIDVTPPALTVSEETLNYGEENQTYSNAPLQPIAGTGPYTWAHTGGTLPSGISITEVGDNFELGGTPAVGSAGVYTINVQVTDGVSAVATQSLMLRILPERYALPFTDNFSTNMHWALEDDWAIDAATGFAGTGVSYWSGAPAVEPALDFTPGNTDNKVLMSSPGAIEPNRERAVFATSPRIDCSGVSNVQLEFRRWYSIWGNTGNPIAFWAGEGADRVSIEITSDDQTWDEIWVPPYAGSAPRADLAWSKIQIDISQWAANKPWIRIRFTVGGNFHDGTNGGFCGWAIDEFVVRETPMSSPLLAHSFELISPNSYQDTTTMLWHPIAYPGTVHDWTVMVDNPTSEPVTINAIDVHTRYYYPQVWPLEDVSFNWGVWTLDQPVTIPANAINVAIMGQFDFQGSVPPNLALVLARATLDLIGTHGTANTPVEIKAYEDFGPHFSAMPGMYLFEVQAGTTPIDNGQPATNLRDFGSIAVNWSSNWLNIVIDHNSSNTLNLGTPTITGADAGEFIIDTNNYSTQLVGNDWTYFSLIFAPTSAGQKNATVTFTHDGPNTGTPFTFEITGFGAGNGPVLKVFEDTTTGPQIGNGSPANGGRDFGQVDIVAGTGQLTVVIENKGTQDLTLGMPTLTGSNEFSLNTAGITLTLAASSSTSFIVGFDPSAVGIFTAAIEFTHNDPGTASSFVINITGEGIILAPIVEVLEATVNGQILNPGAPAISSRNFGVVTIGSTGSLESTILIHNAGWTDLLLGTPVLTGTNAASFSLELGRYWTTRASGTYSVISITFDPQAKGVKTATLEFTHNDTNVVSPFTLELTGIGYDPNGVVVSSTIMLEAREGNSYSDQLQATGGTGPYTWIEFSNTLNSGLTIASDGTISGTPVNGIGTFNTFVVEVTDALGGTEYGIVKIMIQPPVGFLGKNPNGPSGGCVVGSGENLWWLGLPGLAMLAASRFKVRLNRREN